MNQNRTGVSLDARRRSIALAARTPTSMFQRLEARRLMSAVPVLPGVNAAADDTYSLSVTGSSTAFSVTKVTGIDYTVSNPSATSTATGKGQFSDFTITLPSGLASTQFLTWLSSGAHVGTVKVTSSNVAGVQREVWTLTTAIVTKFVQSTAPDGTPQDTVSFAFQKMQDDAFDLSTSTPVPNSFSWNTSTNLGSGSVLNGLQFPLGYVATQSNVNQTIEFGPSQTPIANASIGFVETPTLSGTTITAGKPTALGLSYDVAAGPGAVAIEYRVFTGAHRGAAIYTQRDPTTGAAAFRYSLDNLLPDSIHVYDSTFDTAPRTDSIHLEANQYELTSYGVVDASGNQFQTVAGFDFTTLSAITTATNAARVLNGPADELRNTPLDSVSFRFATALPSLSLSQFNFTNIDTTNVTLTTPDSGLTWIVGNLSPLQTADGDYGVKLLANRINALDSSSLPGFIGSAGKTWTLDRSAPQVQSSQFALDGTYARPYSFDFLLSKSVAATSNDGTVPILIRNASTGALVTTATGHVDADGVSLDASLTPTLADGRYVASLPAGSVRDSAGNLLASDATLPFFVLAGDANHDGAVGFNDLLTLARNYGKSGLGFAAGNFDYSADGTVGFSDLLVLARNYGKSLPAAAPASLAVVTASADKRRTAVAASVIA